MEDYNKVLDATEVAENANGVAAEKMTVYNESLAAAQNRLTASIQQFAQDSNLDQILAKAYDALSKIVDILNLLINKSGILSPLIKALGVALASAFAQNALTNLAKTDTTLGTFVSTVTSAIPNLTAFASLLKGEVVTAFTSTTTVLGGLKAAFAAAGATITTFVNPVTLAVAGIGALLVILPSVVNWLNKLSQAKENALKQSKQDLEDANSDLEETNSQIKEVSSKITEIREKGTLSLTDQAEKERLEAELETLKAIRDTQQEIVEQKKEEQAQAARDVVSSKYSSDETASGAFANLKATATAPTDIYDTQNASVSELAANIRYLDEQKQALDKTDENYAEKVTKLNQLQQENKTKLLEQKQELLEYKQTLIEAGDTSSEEYTLINNKIKEITLALEPSNFPKLQLSEMISADGIETKLSQAVKAGDDAGKETAEKYAGQFAEEILRDNSMKQSFAQAMNISADDLNTENLTQEILAQFQQMYGDIEQSASAAITSSGALKSTEELIDELGQREVDLATKTKSLSDAYNAMTKNGKITSAQMKALIKDYPELASAVEVQNGAIKINVDLLKEKYNVSLQEEQQRIQSEINETNVVIENTKKRISAYQSELAAMTEVLVGTRYVQDTVNTETGLGVDESSKSVESAQSNLDYQVEKLKQAEANLKVLQSELASLSGQQLTYTGTSSSKSTTDKEAKEFENSIKEKMKNLKGVVTTYSTDGFGAWDSQEAIDKATAKYNEFLSEIVDNPKARKIAAEQLGISIEGESTESQIRIVTNALKEQEGTIEEAQKKLIKEALEAKDKELAALAEVEKKEKEQYDNAIKYIEELEETTVSMLETGIDLLDKIGGLIFDKLGEVSDQYDAQLDNLDKISDELDKQKDDFDDKIDAQKEYLKLQKEEMDNADELAEKNKSIADIDAQLMELQYDDSAEAQAKRLKLLDERAEKEKDLADYQKDYDYDTKVNALEKEKSAYDKVIETQKKALEEQKKTIEDAQAAYEKTLSGIEDGFNTFIKILSSDVVKNLLAKALISFGGDTYKNLLYGWNKIFGTGNDADITQQLENFKKTGAQTGQWIGDLWNTLTGKSNQKQANIDLISQGRSQISVEKNQLEAGNISMGQPFTSSVDVNAIKDNLNKATKVFDGAKTDISKIMDNLGKGIKSTFGDVGKNIVNFANSLGDNIQIGITTASDMFSGLGGTLKNIFNLDWSGISGSVGDGLGIVSNTLSQMFNPVANGAASIGDAIGSGITGFFPGIFSAMAQLVTTVGTAMGGVLTTIGDTMASIPVVGWAVAAAAIAGAVALVATIAGIVNKTKNAKVSQPTQSFTAKKHHNGADYVKKENPELDRMLGLGDDETVSILKVGEAVVPTWANAATSSGNSSSYTGSPFGNAVDSAVRSARTTAQTSYNTGTSSISVSMPITIQGDADATTVKALKQEADNIVNKVLRTINNQTRIGGYRNIKAATI